VVVVVKTSGPLPVVLVTTAFCGALVVLRIWLPNGGGAERVKVAAAAFEAMSKSHITGPKSATNRRRTSCIGVLDRKPTVQLGGKVYCHELSNSHKNFFAVKISANA
jgi:hypothetical protein